MTNDEVTVQGETWHCRLSRAEYLAWDKYALSHPWLFQGGTTEQILTMFLRHWRRGIDLNAMMFERRRTPLCAEAV